MAADVTAAGAACFSAGVSACVVSMIGVEPQALFWGLAGAAIGLGYAAEVGRIRAALVFLAVVCGSALAGTAVSAQWFNSAAVHRNLAALVLGAVAHPMLSAFVGQIPKLAQGWAKRLGASNDA